VNLQFSLVDTVNNLEQNGYTFVLIFLFNKLTVFVIVLCISCLHLVLSSSPNLSHSFHFTTCRDRRNVFTYKCSLYQVEIRTIEILGSLVLS